jgi:putative hydrolase of the HAD superfamily
MAIRAVIFDYGGVLAYHPSKDQIAAAAALCDLPPAEFVRALWAHRLDYDAGMDPLVYWQGVAELVGRTFDDALIAEMMKREIDFWSRLDHRVLNWIAQLRADGVKTGILSNLPRPLAARLRTDGFVKHFDHVTFSCELSTTKPQSPIYEHAVAGLSLAPADTLFLDDRPENVAGARAVGLESELYTSWEDFLEIPARYGLPAPLRQ